MTHLRIEQNNIQENVSSAVIEKLYQLATSGDLDASSNLTGNLHVTATYQEYIDGIRAVFPDLTISADNIFIWFQDPEVQRVLLANYIGANGGVTMTQAQSASIGDIFRNNTTITQFNELRFFTATTAIASYAFQGCTALTSVTLPNTCTTINRQAFENCTNLTSIDTSNVTGMNHQCFSQCTNLTSLDFSNVTGFYKAVGGTHVTRGVFPKMTTIGNGTFEYSPFVYLEFGENLTSIGYQAFWCSTGLRTLVFRSTTPPSFDTTNSDRFLYDMSNLTIYVPDASVNDYKTAWSGMTNQITGISNLPQS